MPALNRIPDVASTGLLLVYKTEWLLNGSVSASDEQADDVGKLLGQRIARARKSVPGTGLSHTETLGSAPAATSQPVPPPEQDAQPASIWASSLSAIWGALRFIFVGILIAGIAAILTILLSGTSKKR